MKKFLLFSFILSTLSFFANAQRLLSWTPEFPLDNSTVVITGDATKGNQGLLNFEGGASANIYVHVGVITNLSTGPTDWKYTKFTWGTSDPLAHATPLGGNKYSYTITNPRAFFGVPAGETIQKITFIFRNASGSQKLVNSDGSDMYIPVYAAGQYAVRLNLPPFEPRYIPYPENISVAVGGTVNITGVSSLNSNLTLKLDGTTLTTAAGVNTISNTPTISTACQHQIMLEGNDGNGIKKDSFNFFITPTITVAALPAGVQEGINYLPGNTSATLVLYAPGKTSVSLIGDFNNWQTLCSNQMNKTPDGNYFWITVTGLTPGIEYGYQYLVDGTIKIADPYSQKILDPNNDQFISSVTYPNLKPYPTGLTTDLVSVLQTAEPSYPWQVTNFAKPDKKNLMIYELLIRDFTAEHSYQSLIDSIQYIKNLGMNAIELMPINEFDGNESWGYNPAFYFAPDKYYGTKNKLKEFIDLCHQNGIAVLLDVVYNHCTGAAPEAKLYWDAANNRPAANNPWLNPVATHPYSVYNDFNHTSTATQYLVKRSLQFWLSEYKVDGFRFDLAKGFSQTITNTTTVENYDPARVANLKRYYDAIVQAVPNAYAILEFLGTTPCQEEQEYAAYGFMLWGNSNNNFAQCTMGYSSSSDLNPMVWSSSARAFNNPAVVGYSESHDEERTMYKNEQFGNSANTSYNVKNIPVGLRQEEAAAPFIFMIPGPKMIWQFQERGYDSSINANGGRVNNKPPLWHYMLDPNRRALYNAYGKMVNFRLANPSIFNNTTFTYDLASGLVKTFQIADPSASGLKVTVISNMDVTAQTRTVTFQSTGTWTNFMSNASGTGINGATDVQFTITAAAQTITLQPGEYHIYVSVPPCTTAAPTVTTPVTYCQNATAVPLTATGTGLLWYTVSTGGTGSANAPTPSTATAGSTTYYVSQNTGSCESPRAAIVVTVNPTPAAPTVTTPVTYCQNATAAQLTATGTNLLWYTAATGGTGSAVAPTPSTATAGTTVYYVSQTTGTCEGPRAAVSVIVNALPAAPAVSSPVTYCQNATATALTASGTNLLWYITATGGTGNTTAPIPSTATPGSSIYYVSQTTGTCEGPRAAITVNITATPAAPSVTTPVSYCQNAVASPLTTTGTNLLWYTTVTGGTGSSTAPTPSTTTIGSTNYYVSQTPGSCESPRALITVNITATTAAPTVTSPVAYCQNAAAVPLTATGTNLLWYTTATGGTGSNVAPTPATSTAGSTTYYVSQTQTCGESPRAAIVVNVTATPAAPIVSSPVAYCQNTTATQLTATGTNLLWYTTATGGTGSTTAPTPSTTTGGTTTYYVSQSTNTCEGPRAAIVVNVTATPAAPTVSTPVTFCQNTVATQLTATGTNLLWYTTATGGTGSSTAPTPSTTTVGSTTFYVSQTTNTCEGPRAALVVNIVASTPAPTVTTPVNYCQNAAAVPLTATGTALKWYTVATGGTALAGAPTPLTATVGSTTFYVSQTLSCGEGPRAAIVVNVNAIPGAPTVSSPVAYCQNATATVLTATGSALLWYTTATGGTGSTAAPVPSTTTPGSTTYYVSQTTNTCESPRAVIVVNVTATPAAPTVTTPISYCQNTVAAQLTATGTNLLWYTTATGGTGSATAPTPSTTTVGSTTYYVSQTTNTCESPRAAIVVNIVASTPAPTVTTPVIYCQNATAAQLTATGTALKWYTVATGGTALAGAPTPSTATVGSTTYYVSQTLSCGEGPRAAIVVTVNATPGAPTVTSPVAYCQNTAASALTATGTALLWYTTPTGGTGSTVAPTPSTTTVGSTTYYVSQTTGTCEGPRAAIVVNVNVTPGAPSVTNPAPYCRNATATALTATGTNLLWYTTATGGTGSTVAPIPSTATAGNTSYYVSQTTGTCEGPRATITVTVNDVPTAPTAPAAFTYCQNSPATALTATGTGLLWYTTATGGTGSTVAPTPSTTTAGTTNYYVSQSNSCGESPRAAIAVTVTSAPAAPTNLATTNLSTTSATITWNGVAGNYYTVEYRVTGATAWTVAATGITATTYTFTTLTIGTPYDIRVSANCAPTAGLTFATLGLTTANRNSNITNVRNGFGIKISPDPVQSSAIIDYLVPGNGPVSLSVLTSSGQLVRELYNASQNAGQYQLNVTSQFNALAKGIYIIKLRQNGKGHYLKFVKQ